jgi:hypothetical protein
MRASAGSAGTSSPRVDEREDARDELLAANAAALGLAQ